MVRDRTRLKENKQTTELLKLARLRFPFTEYLKLRYFADTDLLVIRFFENKTTKSKDDMDKGIIYNYDNKNNLVSVEILDLYGVFATI